jgi:hypothetical protein
MPVRFRLPAGAVSRTPQRHEYPDSRDGTSGPDLHHGPPQPLIWLARIFTSSWVAAGSDESLTTLPAGRSRFTKPAVTGLPNRLIRGSISGALLAVWMLSPPGRKECRGM